MIRVTLLLLLVVMPISGCKNKDAAPVAGHASEQAMASPASAPPEKTAANNPPIITSMDVVPLSPRTGDTVTVAAKATDPDNDEVRLTYKWSKNDIELSETSNALTLSDDFKRGDAVSLLAIPDDGTAQGNPGRITFTVGNASPQINSSASDIKIQNKIFTYQVKAEDKDNDPVRYSLKSAPSGMTVNERTGLIQWNVPPDFRGRASVTVSVIDDQGGEAVQSFAFEVAAENPAEK